MDTERKEKWTKHHDYRTKNWQVSMTDEEEKLAEERRAQTGLSKAEFGRQALTTGKVISRINNEDHKLLTELSYMRADIHRLVIICEKNGTEKAYSRILKIEDIFSDMYNYLSYKIG